MTFVTDTGQDDALRRADAVNAAGSAAMFASFVAGSGLTLPLGALAVLGGLVYQSFAVRCPRCGYNLSWHVVKKVSIGQTGPWLRQVTECPQCRFAPAAAAIATDDPAALPEPVPVTLRDPSPGSPWRLPVPDIDTPPGPWGYVENGQAVACTRETLLRRFETGRVTPLVWTPASPRPTSFEEVPELMEWYRASRIADTRRSWYGPFAFMAVVAAGMLLSDDPIALGSGPPFWFAGAAAVLGVRLYGQRTALRLTSKGVRGELDAAWHDAWLRGRRAKLTWGMMGLVALVAAAQLASPGESPLKAGVLAPAVTARGEWWRLLSYGVLHGNPVHLGLNLLAFASLGKLMEVHANRALVAPVLLAGIVGGGLAYLPQGSPLPMVGVSGGLMALIGFLTVVGFRRRERLPHGFAATMIKDVAFMAAVGLAGFRFIANTGHLGGLIAGLLLGALLVPRDSDDGRVGWRVGPVTSAIGWACAAAFAAICAGTAIHLFRAPG